MQQNRPPFWSLGSIWGLEKRLQASGDIACFWTMPRANRLAVEGGIFHLTHRCHDQAFHRRFARDRNLYREKMREALDSRDLALLDYCLASNPVPLLIDSQQKSQVSRFIRKAAGEAYWTDSLAVGRAAFVEGIQPLILSRQETEIGQSGVGTWFLREEAIR